MYYGVQYSDPNQGMMGNPMRNRENFNFSQGGDFRRHNERFGPPGQHFGSGFPEPGYGGAGGIGGVGGMGGGGYGYPLEERPEADEWRANYNEPDFHAHGSQLAQDYGSYRPDAPPHMNDSRRDNFRDGDRERERDRSRRPDRERDRPRPGRRSEGSWERGGRRDRSDRDWSGDRDRGRERRRSRERDRRDRSPRDDGSNMDMSDDSRMGYSDDSRDYSPGRERSRDRDRDRSRRDYDDDRDRSKGWDDRDRPNDREGERWMTETPSATILLRGLNNGVTENDVIQELVRIGLPPKDVRFMRRVTGASRGFGFVEFQTQSEAQRWMDLNQGMLQIAGQRLSMHFSAPKVGRESRDVASRLDWVCKCGAHNFKRRDFCYKCNTNRRVAEDPLCGVAELDPSTHIGQTPCNSLLFRDLDALTTEQGILQAIAALTSLPIKNAQVIRDDMNTSLCFGFIELETVESAKQLHDFLVAQNPPLAIDGKQVLISYAKNTFSTSLDIIQKAQQKLTQNQYYQNYNYYGQDNSQYYNYSQYYGNQTAAASTAAPASSATNAAAVAQTAIMQAQAAKTLSTAVSTVAPETTAKDSSDAYPVYPTPDVSTYQYDKTSGYYYDPSTGLYYEPTTQYYYNAKTSQWMYWDAEKSTYLPAPTQTADATATTAAATATPAAVVSQPATTETENTEALSAEARKDLNKDDKKEKEKTKVAKKIAKDMEKWAKAMNAQKEAQKEQLKNTMNIAGRRENAAADAGFAILQKSKEDAKLMPPPVLTLNLAPEPEAPSAAVSVKSGLVASYGGDSDESGEEDDGGVVDESKLVDWSKLACLLCKRQFQSKEILTKHTQFSDLHKQNLASLQAKSQGKVEKKEYRDRAKERRQKYGAPAPPVPKKQADFELPEVYEQPTKEGIGAENVGSKLLQKMGWAAGQGLGKANQGRTDPIETKRRAAQAGLGAQGATVMAQEGATYKENVKRTMFARYLEME